MITTALLAAAMPLSTAENRELYAGPLADACVRFGIDRAARVAMFLAQVGHESGYLRAVSENLNYGADGLRATFPRHFATANDAIPYARRPEAIANRVYANRMGNGDEASGDGWRHRGRGLIQVTGRDNYAACADGLGLDLLGDPDLLLDPKHAAASAGWFWMRNGLNRFADAGDLEGCTRRVNGGLKGLDDRRAIWGRAKAALGVP